MTCTQVLINKKNTFDTNIYRIYKKNYSEEKIFNYNYRYRAILDSDYWFDMINDDENIIASCSIQTNVNLGDFLINISKQLYDGLYVEQTQTYLALYDVYVEEKFRRKGYATKLLEYVFSYIRTNLIGKYSGILLLVGNTNIPAFHTYIKFFGKIPLYKSETDSIFLLEF